ncbi:MAG: hypothetical protein ACRDTE_22605 [Pseudonocardiaceae bacterium]
MPPVPALEGRGVTRPVSAGPLPDGRAAAPADSDLAVLVLQVSWALADAAHDLPVGRMSAQRREELADTLQARKVETTVAGAVRLGELGRGGRRG